MSTITFLLQLEEPWNIVVASQALTLERWALLVALGHALVLGLPLFLLLRALRPVGLVGCALGGFLVGAAPFGILALNSMFTVQSASTGGHPTVINGVPTLAGWIECAGQVGTVGLIGLVGGVGFWLALRVAGRAAGTPDQGEAPPAKRRAGSWSVASIALVFTGVILVLPSVVKDSSCHSLFRDGRHSAGPQIYADIKLSAEDWPKLRQIFVNFGAAHALAFRSDQQTRRGNVVWRDLNLCNDAGINIDALDQPWLTHTHSRLAGRGVSFSIFALKENTDWRPLARELIDRIETTWPQQTTFHGPSGGKALSLEEALKGRPWAGD